MSHLVLLGDSIFDNGAYVRGRPSVIEQVRNRLPPGWAASLRARDGSVIDGVLRQLEQLPDDASHLIVSAGGNDALFELGLLEAPVSRTSEGLALLAEARDRFVADYLRLMEAIRARGLPTAVCTIYEPPVFDEGPRSQALNALILFNDAILRAAHRFRLPVLDLRTICTEVADYVNEIEPSSAGGAKIAEGICRLFRDHDFGTSRTGLFP